VPQFTPLLVPGCPAIPAEESSTQAAAAMVAGSRVFICSLHKVIFPQNAMNTSQLESIRSPGDHESRGVRKSPHQLVEAAALCRSATTGGTTAMGSCVLLAIWSDVDVVAKMAMTSRASPPTPPDRPAGVSAPSSGQSRRSSYLVWTKLCMTVNTNAVETPKSSIPSAASNGPSNLHDGVRMMSP